MEKLVKFMIEALAMGILVTLSLSSCDRNEAPYLIWKHRVTDDEDVSVSGISFNMDSDSLEEEVEEINFESKDWDEEGMDVDL